MNKYIIKNCEQIHSSDNFCWSRNVFCQDCTDCLLKRVVKLCQQQNYFVKRFPNNEYSDGVVNSKLSQDIIELLQIQEVE